MIQLTQLSLFIEQASNFLWSFPMLLLLMGTHLYFTFRLHFIQKKTFLGIRLSFGKGQGEENTLSPYAALATSLAATIGTGNILGIATAIAIGGAGSVFWCWITGILGIATSYAESFICVKFRTKKPDGSYQGGAMYILRDVLNHKVLGILFALFSMLAAFGVGSSVQSGSISLAIRQHTSISPHIIGIMIAMLAGSVIIGGIKHISKVCTFLVPFMSLFYLSGCFYLLFQNRSYLDDSLLYILKCAFQKDAVVGGIAGQSLIWTMRIGISRGLFTNEAGMGSLPMSAVSVNTTSPVRQALVSMTGVFWDTVVICAVTGLVIVSAMLKSPASFVNATPESFCTIAFCAIPVFGKPFLSIALILFAFATILGWCYYGECGARFLGKEKGIRYFQILYLLFLYLGAIAPLTFVFNLSDLFNAFMAIPNLIALFSLRKIIIADTKSYFKKSSH